MKYLHSSVAILLCIVTFLNASPIENEELHTMSLADLMDVSVVVASKEEESIYDSPGMISSYNQEDILKYGRYTIADLANITPGFSVTYQYGETGLETRGGSAGAFDNNRHLILIDGIPINYARATKAPVEYDLPLLFAKQVEFLRGPASALYGTGAYYGVISIRPNTLSYKGTAFNSRLSFSPTDAAKEIHASVSHKSEKIQYQAAGSYSAKLASKEYLGDIENELYRNWDDRKATFLYSQFGFNNTALKGFGGGVIYMDRTSGMAEHWSPNLSVEANELYWQLFIANLRYKKQWREQLKSDFFFKYNHSVERGYSTIGKREVFEEYNGTGNRFFSFTVPVNDFEWYGDILWENPIVNVRAGVDFDLRYEMGSEDGSYFYRFSSDSGEYFISSEANTDRSDNYYTLSPFLQLKKEFSVLSGMLLTAGVRNDHGWSERESYNQLSPRLGLVQRFTSFLNLKLLYGTALWAPGIKEVEFNKARDDQYPNLTGKIAELDAERFQTLEAGLLFQKTLKTRKNQYHLKAEVAGFTNRVSNKLQQEPMERDTGNPVTVYKNSADTTTSKGYELALQFNSDFGLALFGNYSYAEVVNSNDEKSIDLPEHKISGGIAFHRPESIYGSITGRYVSGYTGEISSMSGATADIVLGCYTPIGLGVEAKVENILDEEMFFPRNGTALVPMPGRVFSFTLQASF